jgi:hypothetical protein
MFLKWAQLETVGRKAGFALYWVLGGLHALTGWLLVRSGRLVGRFLSWFPWSVRLGVMAALFAALSLQFFRVGQVRLIALAELDPNHVQFLQAQGWLAWLRAFCLLAFALGILESLAAVLAFVRTRFSFVILRLGALSFAAWWGGFVVFIIRIPSVLYTATDKTFDKGMRNDIWIYGILLWLGPMIVAAVSLLAVSLRSAREFYSGRKSREPLLGDRMVENLRTHGGDPVFRTSIYWSAFAHVFFIVILPLLLSHGLRLEQPWSVPLGSGVPNPGSDAVVQMVKIKRIQKRTKRVRLVLNANSPIVYFRPDIDDSRVMDEVDKDTQDKYVVTSLGGFGGGSGTGKGKLGAGGGTRGGWPNGMEGAVVRFTRLEYVGGDWDHNMGIGADYNFLIEFHRLQGFKIADSTDHIPIARLRRFPKHRAPAYVYLTGTGDIHVSPEERKTLRWYCMEEGGLIFADNGGGSFNHYFRGRIRETFPELKWIDISNDEILFREPYLFPNGAPPLWHHSGMRSLGLKYNDRWIVFYHQGDIGDAWKTGHSGASEEQAMQAYRLGINIFSYAINQYMAVHFGR